MSLKKGGFFVLVSIFGCTLKRPQIKWTLAPNKCNSWEWKSIFSWDWSVECWLGLMLWPNPPLSRTESFIKSQNTFVMQSWVWLLPSSLQTMPAEGIVSPSQSIGASLNLLGNLSNMKKLHTRKMETKRTFGHFHKIAKCPEMQYFWHKKRAQY